MLKTKESPGVWQTENRADQLWKLKKELKREVNCLLDETELNGAQNSINHALEIECDQFLGRAGYERLTEKPSVAIAAVIVKEP